MKIVLLNGSPRKGNTYKAIETFKSALNPAYTVTDIRLYDYSILPCRNCNACQQGAPGCILKDDTRQLLQEVLEADVVVMATPVYYWGMSAQLKLLIDKFYSVNAQLTGKNIKLISIVCGANTVEDVQYELIDRQLGAIARYLQWDYVRNIAASVYEPNDMEQQPEVLETLIATAQQL